MLELRPNCECCNKDLPPESTEALICSFECIYCKDCAAETDNICPNCGGNLVARPIRTTEMLSRYPASTNRVIKTEECIKQFVD